MSFFQNFDFFPYTWLFLKRDCFFLAQIFFDTPTANEVGTALIKETLQMKKNFVHARMYSQKIPEKLDLSKIFGATDAATQHAWSVLFIFNLKHKMLFLSYI